MNFQSQKLYDSQVKDTFLFCSIVGAYLINKIIQEMNKSWAFFMCFFCTLTMSEIKDLTFNNDMPYPTFSQDKFPLQTISKVSGQGFSQLINQVHFEISSQMYVHEGLVQLDHKYDPSSYSMQMDKSQCQIFPTDFKLYTRFDYGTDDFIKKVISIDEERSASKARSRLYVLQTKGSIIELEVIHDTQKSQKGHRQERINELNRIHSKQLTKDYKTQLLNLNQSLYIVTRSDLKYYDHVTKQLHDVSGFEEDSKMIKAHHMKNGDNQILEFYVLSANSLTIYELVDPTTVKVKLTIDDIGFQDSRPSGHHHHHPFIYITGYQRIIVIDLTVQNSPKLSKLKMNGSCFEIDMFKSTLHVSCTSNNERYLAEFKALGSSLVLNRFYTDLELPSVNRARRVAEGTMALIGDQEIRILNYGVNRNLLLDLDRRQFNLNIEFPLGVDVVPLHHFEEDDEFTMLGVYGEKVQLIRLRKTPAEIYCKFPNDKPGAVYSLLLAFNSTHCSYVKNQQSLVDGSLQSCCKIWMPLQISSEGKIMKKQEAKFMSGGVIFVIIVILIVVIIIGVKYAMEHERKFKDLFDKLKIAKSKGYSQPKAI